MAIPTLGARVQAFNATREQFLALDSGLNQWMRITIDSSPGGEYSELIEQRLRPSSASMSPVTAHSKVKFPKLPALVSSFAFHDSGGGGGSGGGSGNNNNNNDHDGGGGSGSSQGHHRRPSAQLGNIGISRQNVELRGKELLHNAGVLGGKAGDKAKGLFAKGRNKLRGGSVEKTNT